MCIVKIVCIYGSIMHYAYSLFCVMAFSSFEGHQFISRRLQKVIPRQIKFFFHVYSS